MSLAPCRCRPTHRGEPVDPAAFSSGPPPHDPRAPHAFVLCPGYTPRLARRRGLREGELHPRAVRRLEAALRALDQGQAPAVIVSGAAVHSPDNEAVLMHAWLLARGVPRERIVLEPCARHTTTNLRNAGRIVLSHGGRSALIVTCDGEGRVPGARGRHILDQGFYLGFPWRSGFHTRCLLELGHLVGALAWSAPGRVVFHPSPAVFRSSWKERWAGDP